MEEKPLFFYPLLSTIGGIIPAVISILHSSVVESLIA